MKLRRLSWALGFTKDVSEELSEVLYETAVVSKDYESENDQHDTGIAMGLAMNDIISGVFIGDAMSEDEEYNIAFKGRKTSFSFDDKKLFTRFKAGDKVEIGYRKIYNVTYDYVPPNFIEKKSTERILGGYKFESVKRL